mgnify:FL=1
MIGEAYFCDLCFCLRAQERIMLFGVKFNAEPYF